MNMIGLRKIGTEHSIAKRESFLTQYQESGRTRGVLLQTCNRVEWYHGEGKISDEIARHLFRVVSGLESSIIGETAIVNQVKTAYQDAVGRSSLDKSLHKLFQTALFVGKRVRKETKISEGAMSHSQAVVHLLLNKVESLKDLNITVIGANKMNEKIIQFLVSKGASTIFIGNRTYEKAQELASTYNSTALRFEGLHETLKNTDVLISATSAPHFILKKDKFPIEKPMHIFDLAVPRDIDPEIGEMPGVELDDIETIEREVKKNIQVRKDKVSLAEEIIQNEVELFFKNQLDGAARV